MSPKKKLLLIISLAILLIGIPLSSAAAAAAYYQDHVEPNTVVAGQSFSGLTKTAALQRLVQQTKTLSGTPITLASSSTNTITATPTELGATINAQQLPDQILPASGAFDWIKPSYWQHFFGKKSYSLSFDVDPDQLSQTLNDKLGGTTAATDAQITTDSKGNLVITPAQYGQGYNSNDVLNALQQLVSGATVTSVAVQTTQTAPTVVDDEAAQTKAELETSLHSLTLKTDSKTFALSVAEQFSAIDFSNTNGKLGWQVNKDKLKTLLNSKVASKLTVKMVQQLVQNNNGQIIQPGIDGVNVDLDGLTASAYQAITTGTTSPITITTQAVAFTVKQVDPQFDGSIFDGRYIEVNLASQKMFLFDNHALVGTYGVSTGKWSTPTPKGTWYIFNKINLAYSKPFRLWMPFWNGLAAQPDGTGYVGDGIHALVCLDKSCTVREGAANIGTPVSHGCIRLSPTDAVYVYGWAPVGTPVVIR